MTTQSLESGPGIFPGRQSEERDWVGVGLNRNVGSGLAAGMSQTKLLFNEAIPASTRNRATRVGPPAPIVIERLLPVSEVQENVDSTRSSFSFTTLSEDRLQAAVKLAKRHLRQRRLESLTKTSAKLSQEASLFETSDVEVLQELAVTPSKMKSKASSPKEKVTQAGAKRHTFRKNPISSMPLMSQSPPTRDPGLRQVEGGKEAALSHEIHKLQNELEVYIQKVEELAKREEKIEEPLDPEEQNKLEIRRQKQAARSAQIIYVLQQQVKEIEEDTEKLRKQNMWDTKKSMVINRLAAAHRGVVRVLQVFMHQLSDLSNSKVPPYSKELGQLIRQLSLCSAKVEVYQGSAVPETALDILQKLETLNFALSKQEMLKKMQAQACPQQRTSSHHSMPPAPRGPKLQGTVRVPCKPKNPRRGMRDKRVTSQKPKRTQQPINRREVLRTGLESLLQQRELQELQRQSQTSTNSRKMLPSERKKTETMKMQDAGFQQPTVSSHLRVNQLPQKESSVPWIPTSPHSPPPQRSPQRGRPEPRCLFSPVKLSPISANPLNPPNQRLGDGFNPELGLSSQKKKEAQNEALRKAWLDKMTAQRLKELNQLSKEEAERIQRLRSEVVSPTQWAEQAEQKARERIQPLLDEAEQIGESRNRINSPLRGRVPKQAAEEAEENTEQLSEELLDDLEAPTVESMLLRMEEIQRDQEEVKRRFASITYSDPLYMEQPGASGSQSHALGSRPASPQPIRFTKPVLKQTSAVDIVLEKPVETGFLCENSLTEEASQDELHPANNTMFPGPVEGSKGTVISVPGSMLRSIRRYRADFEAYLRVAAHEAVGSFNPWGVADSLADELLSDALADVAAEFQDAVEEYAEAVFTSEFLQPIQSPSTSAAALAGQ